MKRVVPALLGASCLCACLSLSRAPVEQRAWTLDARRPGEAAAPAAGGPLLLVRPFRASAGLDARGFLARRTDGSWERAFEDEHAVPPAERVADLVERWLAASGLFRAVVAPGTVLEPELVLDGRLVALHLDRTDPEALAAVLELECVLTREPDGALLYLGRWAERVPCARPRAEELVAAWDRALVDALTKLERELAPVLAARAGAGTAPR